ncbi:class I SAM-dependent methyltransferase [Kordiimonas pumila]|uniref:Class I SAM-dependent methyltransferase n=1 Tax=Kordiimonas pumila TaxID=2161677 RepID=A0ABV7D617_9PROT|nr:class I SAM-dependent methyltransferase [Kordiimonas pumila]
MTNKQPAHTFFDENQAATYDQKFEKLRPINSVLHLLSELVLANLPTDAHILCVGAGTGAEIQTLAKSFPGWRFTAVEPSPHMMAVCQKKAIETGISERCTFHEGYLDSLPTTQQPFDAATSILVSQFIMDDKDRVAFFAHINSRLKKGGLLISADISANLASTHFASLKNVWMQMMRYSGMPEENVQNMIKPFGVNVSVQAPEKVAALIKAGGFNDPILFCQTLLIHSWYAVKP